MTMAGGGDGAGFWLPTEFLTDDDFLLDKEIFKKSYTEPDSEFCFPTEFPYDFGTQTDQLLEKFGMMSASPQSTLAHLSSAGGSSNSSPNGVRSPPTTPLGTKYDAVGDLIYLAAGQVAKLKLNLNRGYLDKDPFMAPRSHAQLYPEEKTPFPPCYLNTHFQNKQQSEDCRMLYGPQQMHRNRGGMGPAAWTPRQNPVRGRAVLFERTGTGGCATAKRPCAGTGVFLPQRYENISNGDAFLSDSQRRPGRAAVQFHANGLAQSPAEPLAQISRGFCPDYYTLMARRHALVLQQRRSLLASLAEGSTKVGQDLYLPQDMGYIDCRGEGGLLVKKRIS